MYETVRDRAARKLREAEKRAEKDPTINVFQAARERKPRMGTHPSALSFHRL